MIEVNDSCVVTSHEDDEESEPLIGRVSQMWRDTTSGEKLVKLVWYYRPSQIDVGVLRAFLIANVPVANEVSASYVDALLSRSVC